MRILHLSDTSLSGSPIRISQLLNRHAAGIESRHIVWSERIGYRIYDVDVVGHRASHEELRFLIYEWATHIHYHNRWRRQEVFKALGTTPPERPSAIQIHSPRDSEDFRDEITSGIPLAVIAQYHVRQWPELSFIIPNVVDITDPRFTPIAHDLRSMPFTEILGKMTRLPVVSFAPSNTNATGWNDKGYNIVNPILKKMRYAGEIHYDLINKAPFSEVMPRKKLSAIGTDDIKTGSYHLSALEYLSVGVSCINHLDTLTEKVLKDLTGADDLPFIEATKESYERTVRGLLRGDVYMEKGLEARAWMEKNWNPLILVHHYRSMYEELSGTPG